MLNRILRRIQRKLFGQQNLVTSKVLPLPDGVTEEKLFDFVTRVRVEGAPEHEMVAYGTHDFNRFVYTLGLTNGLSGNCLELGANPYFTTMLLKCFTGLELSLANYFGHDKKGIERQNVHYVDFRTNEKKIQGFDYQHFNIETDKFPYPDNSFNIVIFAEIIEHLLNDPCGVLREIKRVLRPEGVLILTTPNVARLENVAKITHGLNIYDPYSGYGPYGRHNREYTLSELKRLLDFEGFKVDISYTADVHFNAADTYLGVEDLKNIISSRGDDLGQYIFIKAKKTDDNKVKRPSWLYRSYENGQLE